VSNEYEHRQGLRITFTPAEFAELSRQARKHRKPVREYIEWAMRCLVASVQADEQVRAG
jgi:hypothetical protein